MRYAFIATGNEEEAESSMAERLTQRIIAAGYEPNDFIVSDLFHYPPSNLGYSFHCKDRQDENHFNFMIAIPKKV